MQGKILVVDAISTNRIVLKVKLSGAFYQVLQAATIEEALQSARGQQPDLIVTALSLPDGTAADLCRHISVGATCPHGDACRRVHDVDTWMKHKPADLPGPCPFNRGGSDCPYGLRCRFSKSHGEPKKYGPSNPDDPIASQNPHTWTRDAEVTRGEADAERNSIFAAAFSENTEFFEFYRSLTAYQRSLQAGNSTMVMSPDSEFFNYLRSDQGSRSVEGERN